MGIAAHMYHVYILVTDYLIIFNRIRLTLEKVGYLYVVCNKTQNQKQCKPTADAIIPIFPVAFLCLSFNTVIYVRYV